MRGLKSLVLVVAAGSCFAALVPATAQVSVNIGNAPECPYGYYDAAPMAAHLPATTAQNGSPEASSSAPDPGFTAQATFAAR